VSVVFVKKTKIDRKHFFLFRLDHPYFDEIEAFEPDEILLKPVEPQASVNRGQYNNINGFCFSFQNQLKKQNVYLLIPARN
jgi:hypothetical protein